MKNIIMYGLLSYLESIRRSIPFQTKTSTLYPFKVPIFLCKALLITGLTILTLLSDFPIKLTKCKFILSQCEVPEIDGDSESSTSDPEADQDTRSTTSLEELTKLGPDRLLYRAAQARNLPVMLEALAQGANPNWHNPEEQGKTPLIMAIESVSGLWRSTSFDLI